MKKFLFILIAFLCVCSVAYAASPILAFEDAEYSVTVGKTVKLKPIAQGIDGKLTYTWTSADESIATVSNGTVKGISGGTVSITCTATDKEGNTYDAECSVLVIVPIKSIKADVKSVTLASSPIGASMFYREGDQLDGYYYAYKPTITIEPEDATYKDLEWTSADPNIASVTENGVIFGEYAGTTTVTGKAKDGSKKTVQIKVNVPKCFVTEDDITISDPSGVIILYKYARYHGGGSYSCKQTGNVVYRDHFVIRNYDLVDEEMSVVKLVPIKAGSGTISFTRNGSTLKTIKIKVEHSAVYDDVSYPKVKVSKLLASPEKSVGTKTQVTGEIIKIEPLAIEGAATRDENYGGKYSGLIYCMLTENGQRQYAIFEHDVAMQYKVGETYTIYGEVAKIAEYTTETGLVYDCPYFIGGHINIQY